MSLEPARSAGLTEFAAAWLFATTAASWANSRTWGNRHPSRDWEGPRLLPACPLLPPQGSPGPSCRSARRSKPRRAKRSSRVAGFLGTTAIGNHRRGPDALECLSCARAHPASARGHAGPPGHVGPGSRRRSPDTSALPRPPQPIARRPWLPRPRASRAAHPGCPAKERLPQSQKVTDVVGRVGNLLSAEGPAVPLCIGLTTANPNSEHIAEQVGVTEGVAPTEEAGGNLGIED